MYEKGRQRNGRPRKIDNALYALRADHRWIFSATPLRYNPLELHAQLRFLRLTPQADYQCIPYCDRDKKCRGFRFFPGRKIDSCGKCGHDPSTHNSWFNANITIPTLQNNDRVPPEAEKKLQEKVLDWCVLQRDQL